MAVTESLAAGDMWPHIGGHWGRLWPRGSDSWGVDCAAMWRIVARCAHQRRAPLSWASCKWTAMWSSERTFCRLAGNCRATGGAELKAHLVSIGFYCCMYSTSFLSADRKKESSGGFLSRFGVKAFSLWFDCLFCNKFFRSF